MKRISMRYSQERKQAILDKLQAPYNRTVKELAAEEGVSAATIYNWRKQARKRGQLLPNTSGTPDGWSSPEKFNAVLETAALTEQKLAEYCRRRRLFPERLLRTRVSSELDNARWLISTYLSS